MGYDYFCFFKYLFPWFLCSGFDWGSLVVALIFVLCPCNKRGIFSSDVPITKKRPIRSTDPITNFFQNRSPITDPINRSPITISIAFGRILYVEKNSLSEIILRPDYWYVACDLPALTSL